MQKILLIFSTLLINLSCSIKTQDNLSLEEYSITMLQSGYLEGRFSISDVVEYYLKAIQSIDNEGPELNSIISINPDALDIAKMLDSSLANMKSLTPLYGIPIILKDNINTNDNMPTTAGSRILAQSYPSTNSWVAEKLIESNAIIIGKANLSEWANYRASFLQADGVE